MPELDSVRNDLALGIQSDKLEILVGIQCRTDVKSFLCMKVPREVSGWLCMDEYLTPNRA
jgi:hypothetical protein